MRRIDLYKYRKMKDYYNAILDISIRPKYQKRPATLKGTLGRCGKTIKRIIDSKDKAIQEQAKRQLITFAEQLMFARKDPNDESFKQKRKDYKNLITALEKSIALIEPFKPGKLPIEHVVCELFFTSIVGLKRDLKAARSIQMNLFHDKTPRRGGTRHRHHICASMSRLFEILGVKVSREGFINAVCLAFQNIGVECEQEAFSRFAERDPTLKAFFKRGMKYRIRRWS